MPIIGPVVPKFIPGHMTLSFPSPGPVFQIDFTVYSTPCDTFIHIFGPVFKFSATIYVMLKQVTFVENKASLVKIGFFDAAYYIKDNGINCEA